MTLKKELTKIIYAEYQDWFTSQGIELKCVKGCATCCSVNVKMTSIEGELIYDHIKSESKDQWFAGLLNRPQGLEKIKQTTNGFAKACLAGEEDVEVEKVGRGQCAFLKNNVCTIYPVRPFSCRCFCSTILCKTTATAQINQIVLTASTVMMQLLEHIAQGEYWGNLHDVLLSLSDLPINKTVYRQLSPPSLDMQARARVVSGKPIPGFLLDDKEYEIMMPLLEKIFNKTIDGKRVEDILNGK